MVSRHKIGSLRAVYRLCGGEGELDVIFTDIILYSEPGLIINSNYTKMRITNVARITIAESQSA